MSRATPQRGIRDAIQLLSSILVDCGFAKIPSEAFRQAKFNNETAIEPFWALLFQTVRLVQLLDGGSREIMLSSRIADKQKSFTLEAFVVRKHLFTLGYHRCGFFSIPAEAVGSQELLLAFAWLVCKSELINKLTQRHLKVANEITFPLNSSRMLFLRQIEADATAMKLELEGALRGIAEASNAHSLLENLQRLIWIRGQVLRSWEMALDCNLSYLKMAHSLHRCTLRPLPPSHKDQPPHLNVHEIFLLRHHEGMKRHLKKLEHHISMVQNLIKWRELEPVFWQWMESVLDLQQSEIDQETAVENDDKDESEKMDANRQALSSQVKQVEKEVQALLAKNQPHIDKINRLWQLKQRQCQPQRQEMESIHSKIQSQLHPFTSPANTTTSASQQKSTSSSSAEILTQSDIAVFVEEQPIKHTQRAAFPSLAQQRQSEAERMRQLRLEATRGALILAEKGLADASEKLRMLQLEALEQIHVLERRLPESVCKIEHTQ